jgi:tetratricopeptide (TPR) repeat protein
MRLRHLLTMLALVIPTGAPAQTPGQPLPACADAANCPLIPFTRQALGAALDGVTLSASGAPGLLLASTGDNALPAFRLMWIDQVPALPPDRTATEFMRGLARPERFCNQRPLPNSASADRTRGGFDLRCAGGSTPEVQVVLFAVQEPDRTRTLVLLAPLANGPALLARGQRVAQAMNAAAAPSRDYAQLREDCADDRDSPRQIAGCNAVLAHPGETDNYAIALNNRGHAHERAGNVRGALEDYDRAIQRDPTYVVAHINRARALRLLDRLPDALVAADRALAIEDSTWARLERARVLLRRGEGDRAVADLDRAIRTDPKMADALVDRGQIRADRGNHRGALEDFEAALAAEPDNRAAMEGRDQARASLAGGGNAPAPAASAVTGPHETVRGLMRGKPFTLTHPAQFNQTADAGSELFLDHPDRLFQISLKIEAAAAGASAQAAARLPASQVAAADRAAFRDFSLEQRTLITLPGGPAHIYVAAMTSPMGNRPKLRMVVAELFSEGRRYELAFTMGEDVFASAGSTIGFVLANFSPSSAPRACCAAPVALPW